MQSPFIHRSSFSHSFIVQFMWQIRIHTCVYIRVIHIRITRSMPGKLTMCRGHQKIIWIDPLIECSVHDKACFDAILDLQEYFERLTLRSYLIKFIFSSCKSYAYACNIKYLELASSAPSFWGSLFSFQIMDLFCRDCLFTLSQL